MDGHFSEVFAAVVNNCRFFRRYWCSGSACYRFRRHYFRYGRLLLAIAFASLALVFSFSLLESSEEVSCIVEKATEKHLVDFDDPWLSDDYFYFIGDGDYITDYVSYSGYDFISFTFTKELTVSVNYEGADGIGLKFKHICDVYLPTDTLRFRAFPTGTVYLTLLKYTGGVTCEIGIYNGTSGDGEVSLSCSVIGARKKEGRRRTSCWEQDGWGGAQSMDMDIYEVDNYKQVYIECYSTYSGKGGGAHLKSAVFVGDNVTITNAYMTNAYMYSDVTCNEWGNAQVLGLDCEEVCGYKQSSCRNCRQVASASCSATLRNILRRTILRTDCGDFWGKASGVGYMLLTFIPVCSYDIGTPNLSPNPGYFSSTDVEPIDIVIPNDFFDFNFEYEGSRCFTLLPHVPELCEQFNFMCSVKGVDLCLHYYNLVLKFLNYDLSALLLALSLLTSAWFLYESFS